MLIICIRIACKDIPLTNKSIPNDEMKTSCELQFSKKKRLTFVQIS